MRLETTGAKDLMVDRIQCMRDVNSTLDLELDFLVASRSQCGDTRRLREPGPLTEFDLSGVAGANGHYAYIGTHTEGGRVYAKSGSTASVVSGVILGEGILFFVTSMGMGPVYVLAHSPDWNLSSPDTIYMSNGGPSNVDHSLVPDPPSCTGWSEIDVTPINPVFTNLIH